MMKVLRSFFKGSSRMTRVYWLRERDGVSVCARVESTVPDDAEEIVRQAEEVVRNVISCRQGGAEFKGVMLGGNGRGMIRATGFVELPWHAGMDSELNKMGLVEAK